MVSVIDINNRNEQIDINDANRRTDINNPNELTNVNNIMNEQTDIDNKHISTCVNIKVCIYFRQNAINLNFDVGMINKLQMFFFNSKSFLCINLSIFHVFLFSQFFRC